MCSREVLCPVCGESILRKIKVSNGQPKRKDQARTTGIRSLYICFSCKMTFFEEDLLKKPSQGLG